MPRPLWELSFALLARVQPLPAALDPVGGGQDADRRGVVWHEAADVVVCQAAVGVRSAAPVMIAELECEVWGVRCEVYWPQYAGPVLHTVAVEVGVMETILCPSRSCQHTPLRH